MQTPLVNIAAMILIGWVALLIFGWAVLLRTGDSKSLRDVAALVRAFLRRKP